MSSNLNGRVARLERERQERETGKVAVIVAGDLVHDVTNNRPYTGKMEDAIVIAHVATKELWECL